MNDRLRCPSCGMPTIEDHHDDVTAEEATCNRCLEEAGGDDEEGASS
jgi:hypothetical protein